MASEATTLPSSFRNSKTEDLLKTACHRYQSEVSFADTDASGWAHFSKILTFVERAEHELFSKLGILVFDPASSGWPRAHVSCDYRSPLRFQDHYEIALHLSKLGSCSLNWQFEITKPGGSLIAEGEMVSVKVGADGKPTQLSEEEHSKFESLPST